MASMSKVCELQGRIHFILIDCIMHYLGSAIAKKNRSEEHRQQQFLSSLVTLNKQFAKWAKEMVEKDPAVPLINAGNDYIQ